MAATNQDLINHAVEFTMQELQTLRIWFDVDQAGNDVLANEVLKAGLMLEHYTSELPHALADRTVEQLSTQQQFAFTLSEQLSLAEAFLQSKGKTAGQARAAAFKQSIPRVGESQEPL